MSTTVVGASIFAALVAGMKLFKAGDDVESYEEKDSDVSRKRRTLPWTSTNSQHSQLKTVSRVKMRGHWIHPSPPKNLSMSSLKILTRVLVCASAKDGKI